MGEIEEMTVNLDQAQILNNLMEKKAKQFDKIVGEWKRKADGLGMDLDVAQKECRNASSELFRIKSAYEEGLAQLDEVRRENKQRQLDLWGRRLLEHLEVCQLQRIFHPTSP